MTNDPSPRRYLSAFTLCLIAGILLVSAWNAFVDPFDIYNARTRHGFNHFKARAAGSADRLVKAKQIARLRPEVLILGTSRADWALEPSHPALQTVSTNVYNAGLAGATMYEVFRYVQHAHAIQPLTLVVIGLDLEMFNAEEKRESFSEGRLAIRPDGTQNRSHRWTDRISSLFSHDALEANRETRDQSRRHRDVTREDLRSRGSEYREQATPDERWRAYRVGVHQARANLGRLGDQWDIILDRMEHFDRLLSYVHREEIELVLFISPYHLSHLEVIRLSDGWDTFEAWKRELVTRNEAVAALKNRRSFALWDFSGYHELATEPHPSPDDPHHVMTWYRESSHYRKITGDLILDRILGRPIKFPTFGVELTGDNLEVILQVQRQFAAAFVERNK
jgi:hypothetical protein